MSVAAPIRYKAFISYSSGDRAVGERLQAAIERYRVPKPLAGRETRFGIVPRRISPIFRDRWDLTAATSLGDALMSALAQSESLIVLCSPKSAASKWVNAEIDEFRRLGRADRILAVIVEGRPVRFDPSEAPDGAFPPALLRSPDGGANETPPFAPDLRELDADRPGDGFEYSKLKIIAALIGISLTELTQRQHEADRLERQRNRRITAAMSALAAFATAGGLFAWNRNLEAQARLGYAAEIAGDRVVDAAEFRASFGVPQSTIVDLLVRTEASMERLKQDAGDSNLLRLQRARLVLRLHEAYNLLSNSDDALQASRTGTLLAAARTELRTVDRSWVSAVCGRGAGMCGVVRTLLAEPDADALRREKIRLADAEATDAMRLNDTIRAMSNFDLSVAMAAEPELDGKVNLAVLAGSYVRRADGKYTLEDLTGAAADFAEAIGFLEAHRSELRARAAARAELATASYEIFVARMRLADVQANQADLRAALEEIRTAIKEAELALELAPESREHALGLATAYGELADRLKENRDDDPAYEAILECVTRLRDLVATSPDRLDFKLHLAASLNRLGDFEADGGRVSVAEDVLQDSSSILSSMIERDRKNVDALLSWSQLQTRRAVVGRSLGHSCDVVQGFLDDALSASHDAQKLAPSKHSVMNEVQNVQRVRALLLPECDVSVDQLLAGVDEAISLKAMLAETSPDSPLHRRDMYLLHAAKFQLLVQSQRNAEAGAELDKLIAVAERALSLTRGETDPLAKTVGEELAFARQLKTDFR